MVTGFVGGTSIDGFLRMYSGKVHDIYTPVAPQWRPGADEILIVASDRIAIFDRVLPVTIPGKRDFDYEACSVVVRAA